MMQKLFFSALIFLVFPTFLWGEEQANTVRGTIGDRVVNVRIRADQSDFYGEGNSGGVSIMTLPIARDDGLGAVSIGFEGTDFLGGKFVRFEIEVADTTTKNMTRYYSTLDHNLQVTITRAVKRDGKLSISGTVKGTLIWRQLMPISERREDPSRQLPVNLVFNAVVENED